MIQVHHVVLLNLVIYIIVSCITYKGIKNRSLKKEDYNRIIFLFLIFCLYPVWGGDYFHYRELFPEVQAGYETHMETVYSYIIQNITPTYFLFRLCVWGSAIYILLQTYKKSDANHLLAIAVFCLFFMHRFSYARVSLAMAISYFGLSMVFKSKTVFRILLGLIILVASFFFHKSALFGVTIIIISYFLSNRMSLKHIVFILILFPFIVAATQLLLNDFVVLELEQYTSDMFNFRSGQKALLEEGGEQGLANKVDMFLMQLTYYSVLLEYLLLHIKGIYQNLPRSIKLLSTASFFTILISSVFAFDFGYSTTVVYGRFILFAMIPSGIFISYCIEKKILKKYTRIVVLFGMSSVFFSLMYAYYLSITKHTFTW